MIYVFYTYAAVCVIVLALLAYHRASIVVSLLQKEKEDTDAEAELILVHAYIDIINAIIWPYTILVISLGSVIAFRRWLKTKK